MATSESLEKEEKGEYNRSRQTVNGAREEAVGERSMLPLFALAGKKPSITGGRAGRHSNSTIILVY
jgi:hypothetical protein